MSISISYELLELPSMPDIGEQGVILADGYDENLLHNTSVSTKS